MLFRIIKFVFASIFAILAIGLVGYTGIEVFSFNVMYELDAILFGGFVISFFSLLSGVLFTSAFQTAKYRKISKMCVLSLIFLFYCFVITNLLFTSRSYWYYEGFDRMIDRLKYRANFIPFKTILASTDDYSIRNILGNLLLMTPMGFFLPIYSKKLKKFLPFLITMTVGILFIEVLQLVIGIGVLDIDDLLLNLLGAVCMYFLCRTPFVSRIIAKIEG